jgi:rubrerythrin
MSVLDDAISLEQRAMQFYYQTKDQVSDPSAKKILELLADEERKHAAALNAMKTGDYGNLEAPALLKEVRGLVEGAVQNGQAVIASDASMRGILQRAMEVEQTTERFYREHAGTKDDQKQRELFEHLADQEAEHYLLVSSLVEFFDRPVEWVESAEFGLRPEY